jgi:hypothetical protein
MLAAIGLILMANTGLYGSEQAEENRTLLLNARNVRFDKSPFTSSSREVPAVLLKVANQTLTWLAK